MIITSSAAAQISSKNADGLPYFRVAVRGGGCSGLSYEMSYVAEKGQLDEEYPLEGLGVAVLVDKKSLLYLTGSQLDWVSSLMYSGFKISNPNEKSSCSCGKSFSV